MIVARIGKTPTVIYFYNRQDKEGKELLRRAQYGDGARRSRRFNVQKQDAHKASSPPAFFNAEGA
jgi:hypothetical protein